MNTKPTIQQIDDKAFLTQFENKTLSPTYFNHRGHLRLGWLYLNSHDVETATNLVSSGIQAYAESLGASTKFHLTITDSMIKIMAKRMSLSQEDQWRSFLDDNRDLVEDALSILYQHFSKELLFSETARTSLVPPDIKPL